MPARKQTSSSKDSIAKLGWRWFHFRNVPRQSAAKLASQGMAGFVIFIDRAHRELTDADLEKINSATAKFSLN